MKIECKRNEGRIKNGWKRMKEGLKMDEEGMEEG